MNTKEAAKLLGVTPMTIRNWADDGKLKYTRTGTHRRFELNDVRDFYLTTVRNGLIHASYYRQQIDTFKSLSKENQEILLKDRLFCDFLRSISQELIKQAVKIAGTGEGIFKKLAEMLELGAEQKAKCSELIKEIGTLFSKVNDNDVGFRQFRNSREHDLFGCFFISDQTIETTFDKIYTLFAIFSPDWELKKVFGAEHGVMSYLFHIQSSKILGELTHVLIENANGECTIKWQDRVLHIKKPDGELKTISLKRNEKP